MVASGEERLQSRGRRTGATRGLTAKLAAGRKIVRVLDAFVKSALRDDPAMLANWNAVKRVKRVGPRAPLGPAPATVPTVAPVQSPASAKS
jgi:hypothetical protein